MRAGFQMIAITFKEIRLFQWSKNVLVFFPMIFAHEFNSANITQSFYAFLAFSFTASAGYLINDLQDAHADRKNPYKRKRPYARGLISVRLMLMLMLGLLTTAVTLSIVLLPESFLLLLAAYLCLSALYTFSFKNFLVIDLLCLTGFYLMRLYAGGIATGIEITFWLVGFIALLFLSLSALKRLAEIQDQVRRAEGKVEGRAYHAGHRQLIRVLCAGGATGAVLWVIAYLGSAQAPRLYETPLFLLPGCLMLAAWLGWIMIRADKGHIHQDPVEYILKDRFSWICLACITGFLFMARGL